MRSSDSRYHEFRSPHRIFAVWCLHLTSIHMRNSRLDFSSAWYTRSDNSPPEIELQHRTCKRRYAPVPRLHLGRSTRGDVWKGTDRGTRRGERQRRRSRDSNPNFFNQISYQALNHLLANNVKTRSNTRHDFYVENSCGKKLRAPIDDLRYDERVKTQGIQWALSLFRDEPFRSSVRLTRCIYMVD
jgi:hypothetical protein